MQEVIITLRLSLEKPVPDLAQMVAQRAYTLEGVENCEVIPDMPLDDQKKWFEIGWKACKSKLGRPAPRPWWQRLIGGV